MRVECSGTAWGVSPGGHGADASRVGAGLGASGGVVFAGLALDVVSGLLGERLELAQFSSLAAHGSALSADGFPHFAEQAAHAPGDGQGVTGVVFGF